MGKVVGLVGAASGKIGNVVYAVTNGIQTARVYQPNITNPKTALQNAQRAKGNLAGRLSSFTPRTAIMGLGQNNRMRRGEFLRNILKNAEVAQVGGNYDAKIDQSKVIFSKGTVPLSVIQPAVASGANAASITLTASEAFDQTLYDAMQTRVVVMVYDITTQDLVEVVTKIATKPTSGSSATTYVQISHVGGYLADVYLIPMETSDGTRVSIDTSIANKSDSEIIAALSANKSAMAFEYGMSQYVGSTNYTPTSATHVVNDKRKEK